MFLVGGSFGVLEALEIKAFRRLQQQLHLAIDLEVASDGRYVWSASWRKKKSHMGQKVLGSKPGPNPISWRCIQLICTGHDEGLKLCLPLWYDSLIAVLVSSAVEYGVDVVLSVS